MSTRSNICIERADGSFDVIYCHWDGYPGWVGSCLQEHYQDPQKIQALIDLGSLSSLGAEIGEKHPFDVYAEAKKRFPDKDSLDVLHPKDGKVPEPFASWEWMCTAYGRDRGESDVDAKHYENADAFAAYLAESWTEWVYVWRESDRKWYFTNNPSPTWFKCCGTDKLPYAKLTPENIRRADGDDEGEDQEPLDADEQTN